MVALHNLPLDPLLNLMVLNPKDGIIGIVLMAVGLLVLVLFVPYWVWTSVLSVLLISIGFLIWRFN